MIQTQQARISFLYYTLTKADTGFTHISGGIPYRDHEHAVWLHHYYIWVWTLGDLSTLKQDCTSQPQQCQYMEYVGTSHAYCQITISCKRKEAGILVGE